jgi:Ca-activated chloride channel family protein
MIVRERNITNIRSFNILLICTFTFFSVVINAQSDKKFIRQGNREYEKNNFSDSEVSYRKAIDKNKQSPDAVFNVGDALYKQNKFEDAGKQFIENINQNADKNKKSAGLYNLGKVQESIDAYKGSLKLRPDNKEAKYNLAYAQDLLKQQQEQQQQQQDKDKQDQNKDNKKEDQKKDQKDQNKDQQKDQNNNQDKQQQQQQQQQQNISKDDAQRLLNALANDEKNVQEKVKLAKAAKTKVRTVKNW